MKNPIMAGLTGLAPLIIGVMLLSCEEKCICPVEEDTVGDYDLLYIHAGGGWDDPLNSLIYSTKSGKLMDTIKTPYVIEGFRFTKDGSKAVMSILEQRTADPAVLAVNYPNMDTIGIINGIAGQRIYFSPDEQEVICCFGSTFSILSFPDLSAIFVDTVDNFEGGFLTSTDSAFYLVDEVDSIFVIDYTNMHNVVKSSITTDPSRPVACAVDYKTECLILITSFNNYSIVEARSSRNLSLNQIVPANRHYFGKPEFRPNSDEVFLTYSTDGSNDNDNLVDIYDISSNTVRKYLRYGDICLRAPFSPRMFEFTPDGDMVFILMGRNTFYPAGVLGIRLSDNMPIHYLEPESSASGYLIRINPINRLN